MTCRPACHDSCDSVLPVARTQRSKDIACIDARIPVPLVKPLLILHRLILAVQCHNCIQTGSSLHCFCGEVSMCNLIGAGGLKIRCSMPNLITVGMIPVSVQLR